MKKRLLSVLLALSVLLGSMPVYALEDSTPAAPDPAEVSTTETAADDDEETSAVQELEDRVFSEDFSNADIPDSEELFALYMQEQMYPGYQISTLANWGEQSGVLNETGLKVYRALKDFFGQVARGEWESTEDYRISMPMTVTYSELGVSGADDPKFGEAAGEKLNEQAQISQAIDYLLEDCPAELYWFDKTTSISWDFYDGTEISDGIRVEGFEISIPIVEAYCTDTIYTANQDKMISAFESVQNAQAIAEKYADLPSAYEKLVAFRDEISALTDYNFEAVEKPTPYGDPWQIVYVFDGDLDTKVVCEGYAKAFQYLCDLAGIPCYTVMGDMFSGGVGGAHMWNVVPMDGQNYLVDVTNYDQVDVVLPELFMAGASGSVAQGYNITLSNSPGTVIYQYDSFTIGLYGENALKLAPDNYVPPEPKLTITGLPETVTYGDRFTLTAANAGDAVTWKVTGAASVDTDGDVTVTDVGDFTITATAGDKSASATGTAVAKELTVTGVTAKDKTYDGNANVEVDDVTLEEIVSGDAVSVDLSEVTGTVSSANAGTYETISLQNLVLTGDKADCYTLADTADNVPTTVTIEKATPTAPEGTFTATYGQKLGDIELPAGWVWAAPETELNQIGKHTYEARYAETTNYTGATATLTVTVTAKTVAPTVTVDDKFTFTGAAIQPEVTVQVDGVTLTEGTNYTVSYKNNTNAGTATVTVQAVPGSGYAFEDVIETFTIEKAEAPAATPQTVSHRYTVNGEQQTTVQYQMPADAGTFTYSEGAAEDAKGIVSEWSVQSDGAVVYTLSGEGAAGDSATLPVIVSSQNYEDVTVDLVIMLTDREVPEVTVQPYTKTYNGQPVEINAIDKDSGSVDGSWSWKDGTAAPVNVADSGTYQLVFTPKDTTNYAPVEASVSVTINPDASSVSQAPTVVTGLTYTGQPQELVTAGTATGGTMVYALSQSGPFEETLPTATNADTYTVWYMVKGDGNHTDTQAEQLSVTIAKAVPEVPDTLITTYSPGAILSSVNLPDGWEWVNPNELLGDCDLREFMAKHPGDGNYESREMAVKVYIGLADCSLGDVRVDQSALEYNGTWQHLTGIQLLFEGHTLQQGIDYTVEDPGGTKADSYVATLRGKGNYRGTIIYQYYILPKPVMAQVVAEDKVYDGTTDAVVTATVETGVEGETLTITGLKGTFAQKDVGENLTVVVDASKASGGNNNYEVTFPENATGSILPADCTYGGVADQTVKIGNGMDTVNLVTTAAGVADETVQGAVTWYQDAAHTQPLTADYRFSGQEGNVVTLYWAFTPDPSETNYSQEVQYGSTNFTLTPKATPKVSAQGLTKTYDGKAVILEDLKPTADVSGSWALDASTPELKNAGDYKVTLHFTPDNAREYETASITVTVKVERRELTVAVELSSDRITTQEALPTASLVWGETLEGEEQLIPETTPTFDGWPEEPMTAGQYSIRWANREEMMQVLQANPLAVNYRLQIQETALLTVTETELLPGSDESYRLEAQEGLPVVPEAVQQAGFPTEEAVLNEMYLCAAQQLTGATLENTVLHDVRLYYSQDGGKTWQEATEENFPKEGITVTLPYPDGTNAADFDFVVTHMLTVAGKAGQVETPAVTETDKGLQFTVYSLSPIAISWKAAPKATVTEEQTATKEPISANSSGSISYYTCPACGYHDWTATDEGYRCDECGYLESVKQLSGYGNVKGIYEPKSSSATAAAAEAIPQTGDESQPVLWAVLMFASALTLGGLLVSRRKRNR